MYEYCQQLLLDFLLSVDIHHYHHVMNPELKCNSLSYLCAEGFSSICMSHFFSLIEGLEDSFDSCLLDCFIISCEKTDLYVLFTLS